MLPSYKTNDPKGWCGDPKRGAAMGRGGIYEASTDCNDKCVLRRVYLDSGGYDCNGTYFGIGEPSLYWCANNDGTIDFVLRAFSRGYAKILVRKRYPNARFYK